VYEDGKRWDGVNVRHISDDEHLPKPDELLALHSVSAELFGVLKRWFNVEPKITIDLSEIDSAVHELGDPVLIAAMAMRKLQALHLLSTPGVLTTTDVVVTIVQDLDRALVQAPSMRLTVAAAGTDWDAAFAAIDDSINTRHDDPNGRDDEDEDEDADDVDTATALTHPDSGASVVSPAPHAVDDNDDEVDRFHELHAMLHEAAFAVLSASDNEIRYFK
jgi:hypothetical protein